MSAIREVRAFRFFTQGPSDVKELEQLLASGSLRADEVSCIIGKTEGNGGRNDFTRELAMRAFEDVFAPRLGCARQAVQDRIIFSLSGGTEGVVTPHVILFSQSGEFRSTPAAASRLVIGTGHTRPFAPEEIGRMPQIEETARVIREIAAGLHLDSLSDVHLVQMKGAIPNYTQEEAEAANRRGRPLRSNMVYSRGASALAAGLALGEIDGSRLSDDAVCADWSLYSSVASVSAKPGLLRTEIMVFGNSRYAEGELKIGHTVLRDILDAASVRALLTELGLPCDSELSPAQRQRLVGVFAKSEADPRGTVRGFRHTMLSDDDISDTRYSRCVLSSVIASITGDPAVYVSTRAEHHGPLGGGPLAIVVRC
jgi:cyanuric acid amidohydrolase